MTTNLQYLAMEEVRKYVEKDYTRMLKFYEHIREKYDIENDELHNMINTALADEQRKRDARKH